MTLAMRAYLTTVYAQKLNEALLFFLDNRSDSLNHEGPLDLTRSTLRDALKRLDALDLPRREPQKSPDPRRLRKLLSDALDMPDAYFTLVQAEFRRLYVTKKP